MRTVLAACAALLASVAAADDPAARIAARDFPSVFQAWSPCVTCPETDPLERMARHDLVWAGLETFGVQWEGAHRGRTTGFAAESLARARGIRARLLQLNPSIVLVAEVRWRDAPDDWLPADDPFWKRDRAGHRVPGWAEGGYWQLDAEAEAFREHVAAQAELVLGTGVFDGVFFDWANEDVRAATDVLRRVRRRVGDRPLLIVNTNQRFLPSVARYASGVFMEVPTNAPPDEQVRTSLERYARALRPPAVVCLEGWGPRDDLARMRAYTTLALTHGDGYVLYGDPNPLPTPDHEHGWYSFWSVPLGRPLARRERLGRGGSRREFEHGTVVYQHGSEPAVLRFGEERRRASDGTAGTAFVVQPGDGDIFLRLTAAPPGPR